MTSYYDSAEDTEITRERALIEVRRHGADTDEFLLECGDKPLYEAQAVLRWLGY